MPSLRHALATATLAVAAYAGPAAAQGQVTVYCSILEEQCREGAAIFEKSTGIKVQMVRKSTGEVYAQVKAEATNPRGDVWWGGPGEQYRRLMVCCSRAKKRQKLTRTFAILLSRLSGRSNASWKHSKQPPTG